MQPTDRSNANKNRLRHRSFICCLHSSEFFRQLKSAYAVASERVTTSSSSTGQKQSKKTDISFLLTTNRAGQSDDLRRLPLHSCDASTISQTGCELQCRRMFAMKWNESAIYGVKMIVLAAASSLPVEILVRALMNS